MIFVRQSTAHPVRRQLCTLKKSCLVDRLLGTSALVFLLLCTTLGTATAYFTERAQRIEIQQVYGSTLELRKAQLWFKEPAETAPVPPQNAVSFPQLSPIPTFVSCK